MKKQKPLYLVLIAITQLFIGLVQFDKLQKLNFNFSEDWWSTTLLILCVLTLVLVIVQLIQQKRASK